MNLPGYTETEDQAMIRSTTTKFLTERCNASELRSMAGDTARVQRFWRQSAEIGCAALLERNGDGSEAAIDDAVYTLVLLAHEFGRFAAPGPLIGSNVAVAALSGSTVHVEVATAVASGSHLVALAVDESGWCAEDLSRTTAVVDGTDLVLNGTKVGVEHGANADSLLVSAAVGGEKAFVVVDPTASGITVLPTGSIDVSKTFASVEFSNVRVDRDAVIAVNGLPGGAQYLVDLMVVVQVAEMTGAMRMAFDLTRQWLEDRYAFGRSLSSFQALKHRTADMLTWLEASYAITAAAARALDRSSADASQITSAAKAYVGDKGQTLMHECVQLLGGLGVTTEHDLHLYIRRFAMNVPMFGGPAHHRAILARAGAAEESAS